MSTNMQAISRLTSSLLKCKNWSNTFKRTMVSFKGDQKEEKEESEIDKKRIFDQLKPLVDEPIEAQRIAKGITSNKVTGMGAFENLENAHETEYFHKKTQNELNMMRKKMEEARKQSLEKEVEKAMEKKK